MNYREMSCKELAMLAIAAHNPTGLAARDKALAELARRDAMLAAAKEMSRATDFEKFRNALAAYRAAEGGGE